MSKPYLTHYLLNFENGLQWSNLKIRGLCENIRPLPDNENEKKSCLIIILKKYCSLTFHS